MVGATLAVVLPTTGANAVAVPAVQAARAAAKPPTGITAKTTYLFDSTTGKALWSRKPDAKMQIGSMTKVMAALVVLKAGHLDRQITITQKYADYVKKYGASQAYLAVGDKLTVRQLLNAMLIQSGCDAAYALADSYGPGWLPFLNKMNAQAKALGMKNTHYSSFDGLPWPSATSAWSTARDQITLARTAMKYATFRSIVATPTYTLKKTAGGHSYTWKTSNRLLGRYPGMLGIKTGTTNAAGYCFLFAARRKSHTVIGVVLSSPSLTARFGDATKMLDWAFHTHTTVQLRPASRFAMA